MCRAPRPLLDEGAALGAALQASERMTAPAALAAAGAGGAANQGRALRAGDDHSEPEGEIPQEARPERREPGNIERCGILADSHAL